MFKKNLLPHMHVIKLIGGTGDGKTEISVVFAEPRARRILLKCVGRTNSTVRERMLIYTTAVKRKIIVAASLSEEILEKKIFSDMVITAIARVARVNGKVVACVAGKSESDLEEALYAQLNERNNVYAVFNFFSTEEKKNFVNGIVDVYRKHDFSQHEFEVYNITRNNMSEKEAKENSNKFLSALKIEVERVISLLDKTFTKEMLEICKEANEILRNKFFEYFNENDISEDGFYYKEISLENAEKYKKFIDAMFTSNNLQEGERLSLEILCSQIFIYVPMNQAVKEIIEKDVNASKVFMDEHGEYTFGILDTRGLYHSGVLNDDNEDYLNELIYRGDTDAVAMVVPLQGDSNEKKIHELYRKMLEHYKKQIPLYMINNKVDLYIDELNKDDFVDDPFSMSMESGKEMNAEELIERISDRVKELQEELQEAQNKARRNLQIIALPCYLKRDGGMKYKKIVEKYNIFNTVQNILLRTAEFLVKTSVKIPIKLKGENDVEVIINRKELEKRVQQHILDVEINKKVFEPGSKNLGENMGICPHGSSYNALKRRLRYGDGYSCIIDEEYFYNCKSFSIDFAGILRNFISDEFVRQVIYNAVTIDNGMFPTQKEGEQFREQVRKNLDAKRFVSILLYDYALTKAEAEGFGFAAYFSGFLKNSMPYFYKGMIDLKQYADALEEVLKEAGRKTIAMNVIYK